MARKPTGKPRGRPVDDGHSRWKRAEVAEVIVDWVIEQTGRSVGNGQRDWAVADRGGSGASAPSACTIAAWILSEGKRYGDDIPEAERRRLANAWALTAEPIRRYLHALGIPADRGQWKPTRIWSLYRGRRHQNRQAAGLAPWDTAAIPDQE